MLKSLPLPEWDTIIRWVEIPGDGPPIVCLPALSMSATLNFLPMLTQPEFRQRRALLIDYIGSGASDHSASFGHGLADHSEAVARVLDHEKVGQTSVIGHSQGGSIAIALAFARPDLVARLIVGEGNLTPGGGGASRAISAIDRDEFVDHGYPRQVAALKSKAMTGDEAANFLVASRKGADAAALHANSVSLVDLPEDFQQRFLALETERHFLWGEETYPGNTSLVTADAPDPELLRAHGVGIHVVPGVGHWLMVRAPQASAKIVAGILDG